MDADSIRNAFIEICNPDEAERGDLVHIVTRGEPVDRVYEVLDIRNRTLVLNGGKLFEFDYSWGARIYLVWRGSLVDLITETRTVLQRFDQYKSSPRFEISRLGKAYLNLLLIQRSFTPTDAEDWRITGRRVAKAIYRWCSDNRSKLWELGEEPVVPFIGRWSDENNYVALRPDAISFIVEPTGCDAPSALRYLRELGITVRGGNSSKVGPKRERCVVLELDKLREIAA